jgi:predicted KAP-like P-loop ATPase
MGAEVPSPNFDRERLIETSNFRLLEPYVNQCYLFDVNAWTREEVDALLYVDQMESIISLVKHWRNNP